MECNDFWRTETFRHWLWKKQLGPVMLPSELDLTEGVKMFTAYFSYKELEDTVFKYRRYLNVFGS